MQFRRTHVHFAKINAIFISHLHGDHCFGLLGLLSTLGMLGRTAKLKFMHQKVTEICLSVRSISSCREWNIKSNLFL